MLHYLRQTLVVGALAALASAGASLPATAQGKGETLKVQDYPGVGNTCLSP